MAMAATDIDKGAARARPRGRALAVASLLFHAACVGTEVPTVIVVGGAAPGPEAVPAATASALFRQVCVDTAPRLDAARGVLATLPFRQSASSGTYYHQTLDLSIKVRKEGGRTVCSLVFVSTERPARVAEVLGRTAATAGAGIEIDVGTPNRFGDTSYYSIFAIS